MACWILCIFAVFIFIFDRCRGEGTGMSWRFFLPCIKHPNWMLSFEMLNAECYTCLLYLFVWRCLLIDIEICWHRYVTVNQNIIQNVSIIFSSIYFLLYTLIFDLFSGRMKIPASCFISVCDQIWEWAYTRIGTCYIWNSYEYWDNYVHCTST